MERILFKKIELWIVLLLVIFFSISTLMFGWAVQYVAKGGSGSSQIGKLLIKIAEFPTPLIRIINDYSRSIEPQRFKFSEFSQLKKYDTSFKEDGVLLVSGWNPDIGHAIVYLYDLKAEKILHRWIPPVSDILNATSYKGGDNDRWDYKAQHPYLLDDGAILFTSGQGPLVKLDACSKLIWASDHHFHHSIERAADGNFFIPSVLASPTDFFNNSHPDIKSVTKGNYSIGPLRDDAFSIVSPDGIILKEFSITKILEDNGYTGLLYGKGPHQIDLIHLNDAEPIMANDQFVRKGDVVLSARNLSTVFLFRPSTGTIIWLKTGPWTMQHDVDYHGNGIFTIFGNNFVEQGGEMPQGTAIYKYDQGKDKISVLLELKKHNISAPVAGLHRVLKNGDVFVEHPNIKLHRVSKEKKRWSFVNSIGEGEVGALNWSRYFASDELDLTWIDIKQCGSQK